jgi:hypothetical protein
MSVHADAIPADELVTETEEYVIWHGAASDLLFIEWQQPATNSTYRTAMEDVLASVQDHSPRKYLCDARVLEAGQHWRDTLTWVSEEWLPQFATTTVDSAAVVYPDDPIGQYMTDEMGRARRHDQLDLACLTDLETAILFLGCDQDN